MLHTLESVLGELQATQPKATAQLRDQRHKGWTTEAVIK